jgi:hypothetical protein
MLLHTEARATSASAPKARSERVDHAHLGNLVLGLLESRASHVDYLDTVGGEELSRLFRLRKTHRRDARAKNEVTGVR